MTTDTIGDIADAAEALTDPHKHTEARRDEHGKPLRPHETIVPGLITQLRELAAPGNDGGQGGMGGRESVPVAIDAVSLLASIEFGSAKRLADAVRHGYRVEGRTGAENCLRALVGVANQFPYSRTRVDPYTCPTCRDRTGQEHWQPCHHCQPTTQTELLAEVRSWRWQAEIIAGWRTPPRELPAPCPACDARGTLLAYADPDNPQARCVGCGQQWSANPTGNDGLIGILAEHVIDYERRTRAQRSAARTAAVVERQRKEGRPAETSSAA